MTEELLKVLVKTDSGMLEKFLTNNISNLKVILDQENLFFDYSWLDYVEECIPFLDSIIRNPTVIEGQQELFYMEKIKETRNLYENRFIKTLISQLYEFLQNQIINLPNEINDNQDIKFIYKGSTTFDNQEININFEMETKTLNTPESLHKIKIDIEDRIKRIYMIVSGFYLSPFMQSLDGAIMIDGTVKQTEIMKTELNYKKMYELWKYLDKYRANTREQKKKLQQDRENLLHDQLDNMSYLGYEMIKMLKDTSKPIDFWKLYINKMIEYIVNESNMDEKNFKKLVNNKFSDELTKKHGREKNIINGFEKSFDNYNKQMKDAIRLFK